MDLPPCPSCGRSLELPSDEGTVICPSCGFEGPVEVDRKALHDLVEEASQRGLGSHPRLAPSTEAPEPRLQAGSTPSMLDGPKAPQLPQLHPPPVPRELTEGAPPPMADPREPLPEARSDVSRTPLSEGMERGGSREKQLKARGELLR